MMGAANGGRGGRGDKADHRGGRVKRGDTQALRGDLIRAGGLEQAKRSGDRGLLDGQPQAPAEMK